MVKDINGLGAYTGLQTSSEQGDKKTAAPASSVAPKAEPTATAASDDVTLSSEAKTLQTLADKINNLPEINIERAEKIKLALENGEYQINDLVLADKILNSDALMGR
jgi:negative regulator of flagellin synthesis FlgM